MVLGNRRPRRAALLPARQGAPIGPVCQRCSPGRIGYFRRGRDVGRLMYGRQSRSARVSGSEICHDADCRGNCWVDRGASLEAVRVILTGILGAVPGTSVLRPVGVTDSKAAGFAMERASHGIGTALALEPGEAQGAFAGLAKGLNGVLTASALPLLMAWIFSSCRRFRRVPQGCHPRRWKVRRR